MDQKQTKFLSPKYISVKVLFEYYKSPLSQRPQLNISLIITLGRMSLSIKSTVKFLSGNLIPQIGFGTYSLKGKPCEDAVKTALECGYRHFDTGSIFKNQPDIRNALNSLSIPRKQVFLSTKVGPAEQGYKQSMTTVENILKAFDTDYLDMVLIHWPGSNKCTQSSQNNKTYRADTWKGLMELKSQGKIRNIGVSNFMVNHLEHLEQVSGERPCINQFEVHPLLWQKELIEYCRSKNIVVEAYSPIGKGDKRVTQQAHLIEIAKKYGKSVAQICLRWVLQHEFVTIPRSKNPQHIKENISIYDFELSKEDMQRINELTGKQVRINWDGSKVLY